MALSDENIGIKITIPRTQNEELKELASQLGYQSVSKLVADMINKELNNHKKSSI